MNLPPKLDLRSHRKVECGTMTKDELRAIRERMKLTQAELAEKLGVASNTVARWEQGKRPIPVLAERFVRVLEVLP